MLFVSMFLCEVNVEHSQAEQIKQISVIFFQDWCKNCICGKLVVSYAYQVLNKCYLPLNLSTLLISFLKLLAIDSYSNHRVLYSKYDTVHIAPLIRLKSTRHRPYLQELYILEGEI